MRILVTNDDGIQAAGIRALETAARRFGDVTVVAPANEQSSIGHAISLRSPLRVQRLDERHYAVVGTPTDCVYLAMHRIYSEPPQLVLSGINHGANLGDDVTYSGTVGAAIEGLIQGVPSIAFSLCRGSNFDACVPHIERVIEAALDEPVDRPLLLNVNFPDCSDGVTGFFLGSLGRRHYGKIVDERKDPRGGSYFWIGGPLVKHREEPGSDELIVRQGGVSVTPLTVDLTDYRTWQKMQGWKLISS
ncbi:MAG: 5'/3'-nucleotidase SurE [Myxococcales bacterium]|nr:5'/3'-nucleotidase SurE [Myxococcales bacterium]